MDLISEIMGFHLCFYLSILGNLDIIPDVSSYLYPYPIADYATGGYLGLGPYTPNGCSGYSNVILVCLRYIGSIAPPESHVLFLHR